MMWSLCLFAALAVGVHSKSLYHATLGPERECLVEKNLKSEDVFKYVHTVTDPVDKENIGDYLVCVWKKRQIMEEDGKISVKNIGRYFEDIYYRSNLSEENKAEMYEALKPCAELVDDKESTLAVQIKNCMITTSNTLEFLRQA